MSFLLLSVFGILTRCAIGARPQLAARHFSLEILAENCTIFQPTLTRFECTNERLAPSIYAFNSYFMLSKDLNRNFEIGFIVDMIQMHSKNAIRFFDIKLNGCDVLESVLDLLIMRTLMSEMRRTSNLPARCPFKANVLYKNENYTFSPSSIPPYTPDSNFTFRMRFLDKNVMFGEKVVWGAITSKRFTGKGRARRP